ncbi:MAG: DNA translocase FtsK, partial [Clostridia bacterium]|nr:DNA translocase FtsK [Clostridia bacterium]
NIGAESYEYPSVDLLNDAKKPDGGDITSELNHNGKMLVDTLKSFNVNTKIIDISRGPAVTRYELQPAAGVKISKITTLADDIALNLAASGVRIEAPIPGKAAVGIEIPNKVVSMVSMKELIVSPEFKRAKSKLTVVLGRDISGDIMTADLAKMPHLLIAGSTGSGKSVCINSFIISILYNARPDEVKLLMVDPKVVELGVYNGIPHLLVPVVTDPRKAAGALNWAVNEMLVRYKKFAETGVRDLASYNRMVEENPDAKDKSGEPLEKMPQIVIIIDELSDLMMAAPNEVEDYICRLAQMARAAGMHLVIATQRPSVDVITGIIKANIPSRIALAVSSQIDSRTILDMSGAEKLLGRGDMLFAPVGCNKPIRVQGCYVTDREIEKVVNSIKMTEESNYDEEIAKEIEKGAVLDSNAKSDVKTEGAVDPMMAEAVKCVVEAGQASTSLLQRRLRVGYARAGRLVDEMEQMGIVGPHEGSKPRQVLITYQQFLEMNLNNAK